MQRDGLRPEPGSGSLMGSGAGGVLTAFPSLLLGAKGWRVSRAEHTVSGDCVLHLLSDHEESKQTQTLKAREFLSCLRTPLDLLSAFRKR